MARNIALLLDPPSPDTDFFRASGHLICVNCGLEYFEHPQRLDLHLLCSGEYVKL